MTDRGHMVLKGGRRFAALLLFVALLQIAGYWFSGAMVNGPGRLAIPQPDTLLYLQSARRVAQGHPFSFSNGTAPSTGTTSVLHPFVLSIPYLMGARGDGFVAAGFALNAFFYLIFIFGWGYVIWRRVSGPLAKWTAGITLAAFGQCAYSAMAQSDIGLWLAVSGLLAAAVSSGRVRYWAPLLVIAPWVRPEGMVCVVAAAASFAAVMAYERLSGSGAYPKAPRSAVWAVLLAFISMGGVFALNYALTGHIQFSSVANKGYFANNPFATAVGFTACDFAKMLRTLVFGLADAPPRQFLFLPLVGGIFFWIGAVAHEWKRAHSRAWLAMALAALGGIGTVAVGGWQDTNVDRYLAWLMPFAVILSAEGAAWVFARFRSLHGIALVPALPIAFTAASAVYFMAIFHSACAESDAILKFGEALQESLPPGASLGVSGYSGVAYALDGRKVVSLNGIYSPELAAKSLAGNLEALKHDADARFDFWLFAGEDRYAKGFMQLQGPEIANGPNLISVRRADWTAFDRAAALPDVPALTLRQRVDIGYEPDEKVAAYETSTRYGLMDPEIFQQVADLNGAAAFDCGRVVYGGDSMLVALEPGKDCRVVMRTASKKTVLMPGRLSQGSVCSFSFVSPMRLNVAVDGKIALTASFEVAENGFTDAVVDIPGSAIRNTPARISFLGDHIAFAYWFFQ